MSMKSTEYKIFNLMLKRNPELSNAQIRAIYQNVKEGVASL